MKDEKGNWITHPLVVKIANDIMAVKEKECGSIMTTTKNILSLYRNSVVAKNTSCSEFHISDLMDSERLLKADLYPDDVSRSLGH